MTDAPTDPQDTPSRPHEKSEPRPGPAGAAPGKTLSPEARRALEEAEARRSELDARAAALTSVEERHGRGGLEPVRYEDWEVKGLATDF